MAHGSRTNNCYIIHSSTSFLKLLTELSGEIPICISHGPIGSLLNRSFLEHLVRKPDGYLGEDHYQGQPCSMVKGMTDQEISTSALYFHISVLEESELFS
jgi:hypothetical protein